MVLPSHHALARRKRVPVESLDDLPCITMERSLSPALHDAAAKLYRDAKIRMHAVSSADNMLGHLQLVQEGHGFALLPDSVSALLPPGVTFRPLAHDPVPTVPILVAWKSGNDSRLVREFVDLARRVSTPERRRASNPPLDKVLAPPPRLARMRPQTAPPPPGTRRYDKLMRSRRTTSIEAAPLAGLTVLDLTLALAGPFATFLLAGLGARVIKIENRASADHCRENSPFIGRHGVSLGRRAPDDVSVAALNRLRGKYAVTLNLKQPGSREIFADLLQQADVVVENFTPGTLDRLGIGYEFGKTRNPRIVYCSISGYGADHTTNGSGKAMDTIIQALSGLMMTSGAPADPPVRVGVPFADLVAPVFAVVGLLAALRQRDATGVGQQVDVSMLGVLTSLVAAEPFDLLEACGLPQRTGRMVPRLTPFGVYRSADGYVSICAPTEQFARGVFAAIGRPDLESDPRFATRDARVANMDAVNGDHREFHARSTDEPSS